ncbi:MAG: Rieske (2Fe-2S) protein [Longimicrobiales bacterium]
MKNELTADCISCPANGLNRRTFLSMTVLAAASAALACSDSSTAPVTVSGGISLADHPSLANVTGVALVNVEGSPVAIVRTGASSFVALSRICPHQGNLINVSGGEFLCSGHQAQFTLAGTWKGGQQTSNMHSYPITFNAVANTPTIG